MNAADWYFHLAFCKWRLLNPERAELAFEELQCDEQEEIKSCAEFAKTTGAVR